METQVDEVMLPSPMTHPRFFVHGDMSRTGGVEPAKVWTPQGVKVSSYHQDRSRYYGCVLCYGNIVPVLEASALVCVTAWPGYQNSSLFDH